MYQRDAIILFAIVLRFSGNGFPALGLIECSFFLEAAGAPKPKEGLLGLGGIQQGFTICHSHVDGDRRWLSGRVVSGSRCCTGRSENQAEGKVLEVHVEAVKG